MNFKTLSVQLNKLNGMENPDDLLDLRKAIYHEELGDLPVDCLLEKDDEEAIHLLVYSTDELVGAVRLLPASDIQLLQKEQEVEGSVWAIGRLMVKKSYRGNGISELLLYFASSFLRSQECERLVTFYIKGKHYSTQKAYKTKPLNIIRSHQRADGKEVEIQLHGFPELDWMTYKSFKLMRSKALRKVAIEQVSIPCLKDFILFRLSKIHNNLWFQKVREQTLTSEQYIDTLGNNLKFVQWTTKILAGIAAVTQDRALRNHYLDHLRGETDHDLWIEEDLDYLGADVTYYRDHKVPDPAIADFMHCQESLVSYAQSPIHFMALPLTIEGVTAFWPTEDMESLKECAQRWGYSEPTKATKFYSHHIHTDGQAEIGHWHQTFKLLPSYVSSEYDISKMYQIAACVSSAMNRAFEGFALKKSFSDIGKHA